MLPKARVKFRTEVESGKAPHADRDAVRDAVAGAAFERVAEAVAEVEQQPLILVELVDFDEPLLRAQAEFDHALEVSRIEPNIFVETFIAAREAYLGSFTSPCREMFRR